MKRILLALGLLITLSGCRVKVYWLPGTLETGGISAQCPGLDGLSNTLVLRDKINRLVNQSYQEEEPERLAQLARQISGLTNELKAILQPEYTEVTYPVTYRFRIKKQNIPQGSQASIEDFSLMGERIFGRNIQIINDNSIASTDPTVDVILRRSATLIEICALAGTAQGLVRIGQSSNHLDYYYRIYIDRSN